MLAAIDAHGRAGDEFGVFGAKETDATGDLAGLAEAADGDLGDDLFQHRFGHGGDHVGIDIARCDGVDGDAEARAFLRQRFGKAVDPALGGGVVHLTVLASLPVDRADIDDPTPAAILHSGECGFGQIEAAAQIGAHHGVPVIVAHPQECAVARDPGIVDDDIDRAMFLFDLLAGLLHRFIVAHIELDGRNAGFFGKFPGCIIIAGIIGNDGEAALVTQAFANGAADSARASGNDSNTCHSRFSQASRSVLWT